MGSSTELVAVPFYGDEILALQKPDGGVYVVIRRICERFGLDFSSQLKKLKTSGWAGVVEITTPDARGCEQAASVIPVDDLPMWLVTIHAGKVAPDMRGLLIQYQREARDVLRQHFGKGQAVPAPIIQDPILAKLEAIADIRRQQIEHEARLAIVEAKADAALAATNGDTGFMTLLGFCKINRISLPTRELAQVGLMLRKKCDAAGIEFRTIRDEHWGKVNLWPVELLEAWASAGALATASRS